MFQFRSVQSNLSTGLKKKILEKKQQQLSGCYVFRKAFKCLHFGDIFKTNLSSSIKLSVGFHRFAIVM